MMFITTTRSYIGGIRATLLLLLYQIIADFQMTYQKYISMQCHHLSEIISCNILCFRCCHNPVCAPCSVYLQPTHIVSSLVQNSDEIQIMNISVKVLVQRVIVDIEYNKYYINRIDTIN